MMPLTAAALPAAVTCQKPTQRRNPQPRHRPQQHQPVRTLAGTPAAASAAGPVNYEHDEVSDDDASSTRELEIETNVPYSSLATPAAVTCLSFDCVPDSPSGAVPRPCSSASGATGSPQPKSRRASPWTPLRGRCSPWRANGSDLLMGSPALTRQRPPSSIGASSTLLTPSPRTPNPHCLLDPGAELGRGAFAVVRIEPHPTRPNRSVAVKRMTERGSGSVQDSADNELAFARAFAAARKAGPEPDLDLEHIVKVYEARHDPAARETTVTMELAAGGSADRRADEFRVAGAPDAAAARAALRKLTRLARDCLRALRAMHGVMRVLHRDIKPANVLLRADGSACLCDFGCCAVLPEGGGDTATDQQGSVLYMAPERLRGEAHSFASDVWALGVTILQLALGDHPFVPTDAEALGSSTNSVLAMVQRLRATEGDAACEEETRRLIGTALDRIFKGYYCGLPGDEAFRTFINAATAADPEARPSAAMLLGYPLFAVMNGAALPSVGRPNIQRRQ